MLMVAELLWSIQEGRHVLQAVHVTVSATVTLVAEDHPQVQEDASTVELMVTGLEIAKQVTGRISAIDVENVVMLKGTARTALRNSEVVEVYHDHRLHAESWLLLAAAEAVAAALAGAEATVNPDHHQGEIGRLSVLTGQGALGQVGVPSELGMPQCHQLGAQSDTGDLLCRPAGAQDDAGDLPCHRVRAQNNAVDLPHHPAGAQEDAEAPPPLLEAGSAAHHLRTEINSGEVARLQEMRNWRTGQIMVRVLEQRAEAR